MSVHPEVQKESSQYSTNKKGEVHFILREVQASEQQFSPDEEPALLVISIFATALVAFEGTWRTKAHK